VGPTLADYAVGSISGVHVAMSRDYLSFGLQDKIAIVTGASQGIGRAIALGLAQAGAHVVLAKHPEGRHEEIKVVQAEIDRLGRKAPIILVDVAKVDQVRSMIASLHSGRAR
jgi:2-dehydro-3-deoxy-D-gluconate 5-dehydrogenase